MIRMGGITDSSIFGREGLSSNDVTYPTVVSDSLVSLLETSSTIRPGAPGRLFRTLWCFSFGGRLAFLVRFYKLSNTG